MRSVAPARQASALRSTRSTLKRDQTAMTYLKMLWSILTGSVAAKERRERKNIPTEKLFFVLLAFFRGKNPQVEFRL
jgi:hypothetical protein